MGRRRALRDGPAGPRILQGGGQEGGGQATFLPLEWLNGGAKVHVPEDDAVLGEAGQLVGSAYPALLQNLLGTVVIVRDLGAAERL